LSLDIQSPTFRIRLAPLAGLVLLSSVMAGCQDGAAGKEAQGRVEPAYDETSGRLTRIGYDSNNNGTLDTWAFMDGARLTKLEADENEDGKIDRWEYYPANAAPGPLKQPPERIERATRFDGQVSRREFFEEGALARVEEDTDGNGSTDKWETYAAGGLVTLALDTTGRGRPDRRMVYRIDGSLERLEADPTGSGQFQPVK
jgi:hypothetical protein